MARGCQGKRAAWIVFLLVLAFLCILVVDDVRRAGLPRRQAIQQKAQFNAINAAIELFNNETGPFPESMFVLCDVCKRTRPSGKKTGMPILYYRADPLGTANDVVNPDNPENIYCSKDNQALLALGVPGKPRARHPLADPKRFYWNMQDREIPSPSRPHRADTFILISAGQDGEYGTADDICNFEWKYREP